METLPCYCAEVLLGKFKEVPLNSLISFNFEGWEDLKTSLLLACRNVFLSYLSPAPSISSALEDIRHKLAPKEIFPILECSNKLSTTSSVAWKKNVMSFPSKSTPSPKRQRRSTKQTEARRKNEPARGEESFLFRSSFIAPLASKLLSITCVCGSRDLVYQSPTHFSLFFSGVVLRCNTCYCEQTCSLLLPKAIPICPFQGTRSDLRIWTSVLLFSPTQSTFSKMVRTLGLPDPITPNLNSPILSTISKILTRMVEDEGNSMMKQLNSMEEAQTFLLETQWNRPQRKGLPLFSILVYVYYSE
jgi:hypothetical protein